MNTQISLKVTAFAVAVMMNSVLLIGVAYLFNGRIDHHTSVISTARAPVQAPVQVAHEA
jgi:hypothetical protein